MGIFISFMVGLFFGMFLTALFQANRNVEDMERAEHAIKIANYYKDKCKEMQERLREYEGNKN